MNPGVNHMRRTQHGWIAVALVALFAACQSEAQQTTTTTSAETQQEANQPAPVVGELVSVNSDTKTIRVRRADNSEMEFSYTDATEIIGADKGLQGLATPNGSEVTVHYSKHGNANVATKIEVTAKRG